MAKSMKPSAPARPAAKPLTPEEKKEQAIRLYIQKKASLAEGILFNLCQGGGNTLLAEENYNGEKGLHLRMVKIADEMATEFMKVVYYQDVKVNEENEENEKTEE